MKTIRTKLWTFIMLIVAAVLLMVWLFQIAFLEEYYVRDKANRFQKSAKQIAQMFEDEGFSSDFSSEAWQSLNILVTSTDCDAVIVNPDTRTGFPWPGTDSDRIELSNILLAPIWDKFETGQSFVYIPKRSLRIRSLSPRSLHMEVSSLIAVAVGEPFYDADGQLYYLCLMTFLEPLQNTTWVLRRQLTLITMVSTGIATLLVFWLARYITEPVLEITRAADRIAGGDYETRVRHKGEDEIGVLADTMNNMARKLSQNERMQRDFIANTSHELKTPISAIRANAELVMDIENQNEAERRQFLQVIVDESIRLNNMIEDILDLSAMESGRQPSRDDFDISEMLRDVQDRLSALIEEKGVSFLLDIEGDTTVNADPQMMFRVFYNLVDNAVKYTPAGGHIAVRTKPMEAGVRVEIQDDGCGILSEDLVYIWDRFYKVDKARSRDGGSSGLGLAIVKSILDAHGFAFGMESEVGKGTLAWVEMTQGGDKAGKPQNA